MFVVLLAVGAPFDSMCADVWPSPGICFYIPPEIRGGHYLILTREQYWWTLAFSRPSDRFYGKWTTLPDGHAFDYTTLGLSTYKGRITVRHAREDGAFVTFISFGKPYRGTYADASARHAATMAMAALRAGEGEKVLPLIREAGASSGVWGEYWEINEPGVAECRPWFMTAAGNCLYAINSMLLMEADGECRIGAGVPKEWKDWSFRLPAESGYEVDFAMKGGVVTKLVLRQQAHNNKRGGDPRTIKVVLPDGSRRTVAVQFAS